MVSRITLAVAMAAGLTAQMKGLRAGTIMGDRSILVVDPDSPDVRAAYPLVTETDAARLERAGLAERYDGDIPSPEEQAEQAQKRADELYDARVEAAAEKGQVILDSRPRIAPLFAPTTTVDEAAAGKVETFAGEDASVEATTGLDTRNTTHFTRPLEDQVGSNGGPQAAGTGIQFVEGDGLEADAAPTTGRRGRGKSSAPEAPAT